MVLKVNTWGAAVLASVTCHTSSSEGRKELRELAQPGKSQLWSEPQTQKTRLAQVLSFPHITWEP